MVKSFQKQNANSDCETESVNRPYIELTAYSDVMEHGQTLARWGQCYKTFFGLIYITNGVFPCDFD